MGGINKRKGLVTGTEASDEFFTVYADVSCVLFSFIVENFASRTFYSKDHVNRTNFRAY